MSVDEYLSREMERGNFLSGGGHVSFLLQSPSSYHFAARFRKENRTRMTWTKGPSMPQPTRPANGMPLPITTPADGETEEIKDEIEANKYVHLLTVWNASKTALIHAAASVGII
jgi:hypothetical protein